VTAVLLAIFLGFWSYLYTYKADAKLFWVSIVVPPAAAIISVLLSGERILGVHILMALLVVATFAVIAIIRQGTRPESWFARYPNG
jgi:drug/metabolite transporter (DMT)-like permease